MLGLVVVASGKMKAVAVIRSGEFIQDGVGGSILAEVRKIVAQFIFQMSLYCRPTLGQILCLELGHSERERK